MNLRTTFLLLLLTLGGGALWFFQDALAEKLGVAPPPRNEARTPTFTAFDLAFHPDRVTRIEIQGVGEPVVLTRQGKSWSLPGSWPTRGPEVTELVGSICGLASRFEAVPLTGDKPDLTPFGLAPDQKPLKVDVTVEEPATRQARTYHLTVGEATTGPNPFTRPTYLRLDDLPEVVRMPPGLLNTLRRPLTAYQKRQLFPEIEKVRFPDSRPTFDGDAPVAATTIADAASIKLAGPDGEVTLKRVVPRQALEAKKPGGIELSTDRLATRWTIAEPVNDRVDPEKLKGLLAAIPELWVESFQANPDPKKTGLDKPERKLTVEFDDRAPVTLLIGNVSRENRRKPPEPPPNPFGAPPPPPAPEIVETFRYAKLPDNPQIFEIRADKLVDLFVPVVALRDPKPLRFRPSDVRRLEIVRESGKLAFAREKDSDRWKIVEPLQGDGESAKVNEIVDRLAELSVPSADIVDKYDAKALRLDPAVEGPRVVLEVAEDSPAAANTTEKKTRTLTLRLGLRDETKNRLNIQAVGNSRVNLVPDELLKLIERPVTVYRGRRLIDVASNKIASIAVSRGGKPAFKLGQTDGKWSLLEPIQVGADAARAGQLASSLSRLDAVEFVADDPKPEELSKFGLDQPVASATVNFTDNLPAKTLLIGKPRDGKSEVFAKLADAPAVFAVKPTLRDDMDQAAVAFRPLLLWNEPAANITSAEVTRGSETYSLNLKDGNWLISGPFDAPAVMATVQPLTIALSNPRADRYETNPSADLATYGLDKPALKVTIVAGTETKQKHTLLIGKPSAPMLASRFAKRVDDDAIFVLPQPIIAAIDRSPLQLLNRQLLDIAPSTIQAVEGKGKSGDWKLALKDGNWQVTSLAPPYPADRVAVESLLRLFSGLDANKIADFGPKIEASKFGLDKPVVRVSISTQDGKQQTLLLGKANESGDVYARVEGSPAVGVLPVGFVKELDRKGLDFADRLLLSANLADLTGLRRAGEDDLEFQKSAEGWLAKKPENLKPDNPSLDDLAEKLTKLRASRIISVDASELRDYGLDEPEATVTLDLKGGAKVIKVGSTVGKTDERFAMVEGQKVIGVLPAALSRLLVAEPLKYRDRAITRFADADRVTIERGSRVATFSRAENLWRLTKPVAAETESMELDEVVGMLARLRADELVEEKPEDLKEYGLDKPLVHWVVNSGDKAVLDLMLGKEEGKSGRHYAKRGNGAGVFLLDRDLSSRLLGEYRRKTLWPNFDASQIDSIVYVVDDRPLVLQKTDTSWQVPGKPDAVVQESVVTDILATLATMKIERYVVDANADLKQYGLQPAQRTIAVRPRTGAPIAISLGTTEGDSKRVYARIVDKERTEVFVLSEADSGRLIRKSSDFTK